MSEMSAEATPAAESIPTEVAPEVTPEATPVADAPAGEIKTNPAWQPVLDVLPSSLHEIVAPTLKEWDRGVNERFREIHGEYEPLKPYQSFLDQGVSAEDLQAAVGLMQRLNESPEEVFNAMREYYKFGEAETPGAQDGGDPDPYADPNEQRLNELQQTVEQLTQQIQSEREQAQQSEQDKALQDALSEAKEKHGDFDREFVLTQMAAGATLETAIGSYKSLVEKIRADANRPSAPQVVGAGSGGVAAPKSTAGMSASDRKSLVASILKGQQDS